MPIMKQRWIVLGILWLGAWTATAAAAPTPSPDARPEPGLPKLDMDASAATAYVPRTSRAVAVRINPIGFMYGIFGGDIDVGVWKGLAVGPGAQVYTGLSGNTNTTYYQVGGTASYFLTGRRFTTSPFLRASGYYLPLQISRLSGGQVFQGSLGNYTLGFRGGYGWFWENGINLNLALGAAYLHTTGRVAAASTTTTISQNIRVPNTTGFQPLLEISVGWSI